MAKVEIKYVQSYTDRHGNQRNYYRRKGYKSVPLPGVPGSSEFAKAYEAASAQLRPQVGLQASDRSIGALIARYYASAEFRSLRPSSQRPYRNQLEKFRELHGSRSAISVQPIHLNAIFERMSDTPHAAANLRKRLRRVFAHAVRIGWRNDNPVKNTDIGRLVSKGIAVWNDAHIAQFEAYWPSGTPERRAFALLLHTGQRRSDVVKMGWQHVEGNLIRVEQTKTGHQLKIPISDDLRRELNGADGLLFLTTSAGKPYTVDGFGNWFRQAVRKAGLPGLSPHGLRKAAGRRLAEAGCTPNEIAAILGHKTLNEVARYTRSADQELLAVAGMEKVWKVKR